MGDCLHVLVPSPLLIALLSDGKTISGKPRPLDSEAGVGTHVLTSQLLATLAAIERFDSRGRLISIKEYYGIC